jgi:hypothetical protein
MRTEAATPKFGVEARPWVTPALKHAFKEKHFKALARSSMKQKGIKGHSLNLQSIAQIFAVN